MWYFQKQFIEYQFWLEIHWHLHSIFMQTWLGIKFGHCWFTIQNNLIASKSLCKFCWKWYQTNNWKMIQLPFSQIQSSLWLHYAYIFDMSNETTFMYHFVFYHKRTTGNYLSSYAVTNHKGIITLWSWGKIFDSFWANYLNWGLTFKQMLINITNRCQLC